MTDRTLSAADAPAALNAFVRGIERRAAVFAELLCGDAIAGDAALAAAIRAFSTLSNAAAMPEWPWRFWGLLLAAPQLRRVGPGPSRSGSLAPLSDMAQGPRAAVLLRLAGGLDEADAARALGLATGTYRMALQRALPHRADGTADADAWRALGEGVQARIKALRAPRLAHLARIREAAISGKPMAGPPVAAPSGSGRAPTDVATSPRWQRPALYALAGLTLAALATTFLVRAPEIDSDGAPRIRRSELPAAEPPASTFDARTALLSHRDFDVLIDAQDEALSRELDFHAWLAAESVLQTARDLDAAAVSGSNTDAKLAAELRIAQDVERTAGSRDAR